MEEEGQTTEVTVSSTRRRQGEHATSHSACPSPTLPWHDVDHPYPHFTRHEPTLDLIHPLSSFYYPPSADRYLPLRSYKQLGQAAMQGASSWPRGVMSDKTVSAPRTSDSDARADAMQTTVGLLLGNETAHGVRIEAVIPGSPACALFGWKDKRPDAAG
eukprot:759669-Hanusia_phi.AAC.2